MQCIALGHGEWEHLTILCSALNARAWKHHHHHHHHHQAATASNITHCLLLSLLLPLVQASSGSHYIQEELRLGRHATCMRFGLTSWTYYVTKHNVSYSQSKEKICYSCPYIILTITLLKEKSWHVANTGVVHTRPPPTHTRSRQVDEYTRQGNTWGSNCANLQCHTRLSITNSEIKYAGDVFLYIHCPHYLCQFLVLVFSLGPSLHPPPPLFIMKLLVPLLWSFTRCIIWLYYMVLPPSYIPKLSVSYFLLPSHLCSFPFLSTSFSVALPHYFFLFPFTVTSPLFLLHFPPSSHFPSSSSITSLFFSLSHLLFHSISYSSLSLSLSVTFFSSFPHSLIASSLSQVLRRLHGFLHTRQRR